MTHFFSISTGKLPKKARAKIKLGQDFSKTTGKKHEKQFLGSLFLETRVAKRLLICLISSRVMIAQLMSDMIQYFQQDIKRINHALKVYDFAYIISKETHVDEDKHLMISVAALLHDIGIKEAERKYQSCSGKYQEIEGPPIATQILLRYDLG